MSAKRKQAPMKIDELAVAAGVPVRTVRYYLARGVLPAPEFRGPNTVYGPEYLARLRAIQRLQADYLPLDAIAEAVAGRPVEELERLAREGVGRRVLGEPLPATARTAADDGQEMPESNVPQKELVEPVEHPAPRQMRVTRWRLAPGVELEVDEAAPPASRRLVERLLKELAGESAHRKARRRE